MVSATLFRTLSELVGLVEGSCQWRQLPSFVLLLGWGKKLVERCRRGKQSCGGGS